MYIKYSKYPRSTWHMEIMLTLFRLLTHIKTQYLGKQIIYNCFAVFIQIFFMYCAITLQKIV